MPTSRRIFAALRRDRVALSFLIAFAILVLLIPLSCVFIPIIGYERMGGAHYSELILVNGLLIYEHVDARQQPGLDDRDWHFTIRTMDQRGQREFSGYFQWKTLGFRWIADMGPGMVVRLITIPLWLPTLLATLPLILRYRRIANRYHRLEKGCCPLCGYDLRATPGKCSECGWLFGQRIGR